MPHIFDFRWKENLTPVFQTISGLQWTEIAVKQEKPFFLQVEETPLKCVGNYNNGEYSPCGTHEEGVKKCDVCKRADEYFPCQFCNGFNCQKFRDEKIENCDASHMVYLALFTSGLVKVGVSRMSRGKARQVEQGSHFTRIFAENLSGIAARRMEHALTQMGFPDKVPSSQKKDFLFPEISRTEGKNILEQKATDANEFLTSHAPEYKKYIITDEKFWDLTTEYADDFKSIENSTNPFHFVTLQPGESLGGTLKMVKGPFIVVDTKDEIVAFSAKDLGGYCVCFDECDEGLHMHDALQSSLF